MKKLILILLLLLLTVSCSSQKLFSVYNQTYSKEQAALKDVYAESRLCGLDSIPMDKWITLRAASDNGSIIQRMTSYQPNKKTLYKFTYSTVIKKDTVFQYSFNIICFTSDRKLQNAFVKK
jgi:hypothetical protein